MFTLRVCDEKMESTLPVVIAFDVLFNSNEDSLFDRNIINSKCVALKIREQHLKMPIQAEYWLDYYHDTLFYQLFRVQKTTFLYLLNILAENDTHNLIKKKYRGGNFPVDPKKGLLMFLWYIAKQDTLSTIAEVFRVVPSTVMNIINCFLYVLLKLKKRYIFWPRAIEEINHVVGGFRSYPGR